MRKLGKKSLIGLITFILVILPTALLILFNAKSVQAVWYNDDWGYRYPITLTNSTGAVQTNLQKLLTIDTSTLVTAGKLQSTCADLRFTDNNGKVIPYYIDSGCNTTTTKVWVYVWNIPQNGSNIYMYYGNPSAYAGSNSQPYFDNVVGLVGYWTMNDTSGSTATDSSVNANNGTATGTTIGTGQYGNDRVFNGTSDYVNISNSSTVHLATTFTLSAWVKPSSLSSTHFILGDDDGGSNRSYVWGTSGSKPFFSAIAIADYISNSASSVTLTTGQWYHMVLTYDGTNYREYVNGTLGATVAGSHPNTSSGAVQIGVRNAGVFDSYWNGQIDDVHIYNTARTAAQISSDYTKTYTIQTSPLTVTTASGSEEKAPSPVAYWKFDDGTGTTAKDSTTNANNATLGGATLPTWQTEDQCISGKCLYFDGSTSKITGSKVALGVQTVALWVRPNTLNATTPLIDLDGGTHKITVNASGTVTATGFTSPTIYVNGLSGGTVSANRWNYVEVTTGTAFNSTATLTIATDGTNYTKGFFDEIKIYNYARSAAQIQADYNARSTNEGASSVSSLAANQGTTLSNGLVGYWKMNESSWTNDCTTTSVTDSSGNGNNGKACPATTGPTGGASGKFGNGGSFDGVNDYVDLGTASATQSQDITIGFWVNPNATQNSGIIAVIDKDHASAPAQGWVVQSESAQSSKIYYFGYRDDANTWQYSNSNGVTFTDSTWQHVVFVKSGTTVSSYKNGALVNTFNATNGTISYQSNRSLWLGNVATNWAARYFKGSLDDVRIYNRALSPAEVSQLYNFAPGPVVYLKMDEGTGTAANDSSGNSNNGTVNSGTWSTGKYGKGVNVSGSSGSNVSVPDFSY